MDHLPAGPNHVGRGTQPEGRDSTPIGDSRSDKPSRNVPCLWSGRFILVGKGTPKWKNKPAFCPKKEPKRRLKTPKYGWLGTQSSNWRCVFCVLGLGVVNGILSSVCSARQKAGTLGGAALHGN